MYQLLRKRLAGKKGFTLIELIVVIAVIAILAVILIPRFVGFTKSAREKSVMSDARNVLMALEALDAEGKLKIGTGGKVTGFEGEAAGETIKDGINKYLGKDLLKASLENDGDCMLVGDVTRSTTGFEFTITKLVASSSYAASVTGSKITVAEATAPGSGS